MSYKKSMNNTSDEKEEVLLPELGRMRKMKGYRILHMGGSLMCKTMWTGGLENFKVN